MFKTLKDKLLYPFSHDILFLVLVFVILSVPVYYDRYDFYVLTGAVTVPYYAYLSMMFFVFSYLLTLVVDVCRPLSLVLKPILVLFLLIISSLNVFCVKMYHCLLSGDYVEIITGTNPQEAKEFVGTYLTISVVLVMSLILLAFLFLSVISVYKQFNLSKFGVRLCIGILAISVVGSCRNSGMIEAELGFSTHGNHWKFQFDEIVDLRQHPTHPIFTEIDSIHSNNIILIIGESFAKKHSSLYGYELETNPLLAQKEKEGNLTVFQNVESPATHTTKTFKYLLTTYKIGDEEGQKKWYDYTNALEAFNVLHYDTRWISCQNETGMFDNLPSGHSKLCKYVIFDEREQLERYDDFLISAFSPALAGNNFIVYHMYGQHPACSQRYPDSFCKFGHKIELGEKAEKSVMIADYDNATLFNDFVVSSIMDLYKDQNAIILYCSDHGLDVFDSDGSHFGHANATEASLKIGKQIPFMIYQTDEFMITHPALSERIRKSKDLPFCTDKLIYLLLDIAGYRFDENDDVERFSVLSRS